MIEEQLKEHRKIFDQVTLCELFDSNRARSRELSFESSGVWIDLSKNHLTAETLSLLVTWAKEKDISKAIKRLLEGEIVNVSEGRAARHTRLRDLSLPEVRRSLEQIDAFVETVRRGDWLGSNGEPVTDIVTLGIGGSDLGARLVVDALSPYQENGPRCHFVANLDSVEFDKIVEWLNPSTTLFIIASKSFTTRETMLNAGRAARWLSINGIEHQRQHFVAVTACPEAVEAQEIPVEKIFCFDEAVGGRFSLWSSIGLPIALAVGIENFKELLSGAAEMDQHFQHTPPEENLPVLLALAGAWYTDYWGTQSRAVLPYVHGLRGLPGYLRQLEMESNGKSVTVEGEPVAYATCGVIWGASGAIGQHSFSQMLHQGTHLVPVEFISVLGGYSAACDGYTELFSNCLAQSRVLMAGKSIDEVASELKAQGLDEAEITRIAPHKVMPGNRPSTTILLEQLTPHHLGALLALYEHKVYVQSVLWDINPFDQWGVEYGKQMSSYIYESLKSGELIDGLDSSTIEMIKLFRNH